MKSYMISLLVIGIALGGLGLGTFAYFTDQDVIPENYVATGNLDLGVQTVNLNGAAIDHFAATGILPGEDMSAGYVFLWNKGTSDIKWKGYLTQTGGDNLKPVLKVQLLCNPDGYHDTWPAWFKAAEADTRWGGSNVNAFLAHEDAVAGDDEDIDDDGFILFNKLLDGNYYIRGGDTPDGEGGFDIMEPGFWQIFEVVLKLDENAGNAYQNNEMEFKITFDSTQFINPDWPDRFIPAPKAEEEIEKLEPEEEPEEEPEPEPEKEEEQEEEPEPEPEHEP